MSVLSSALEVFLDMLEWFETAFGTVTNIFYNSETGLTFVGVVSFITFAVALFTLVIGWIRGLIR